MHAVYEQLESGRGAEHRVGNHNLDKNISNFGFLPTRVIGHFEGKFSVIKLSVSILGQTTGYKIYTVSRKPIRLPEIQYSVFGI